MQFTAPGEKLFDKAADWFNAVLRTALLLLMAVLVVALFAGIIKSGVDLAHNLRAPLSTILQDLLLDAVFILALTEIILTVLGYLQDGRVHVRFIVDTVLIIMLNEVVAIWFKHPDLPTAIGLSVTILSLAAIRFSVTRFASKTD